MSKANVDYAFSQAKSQVTPLIHLFDRSNLELYTMKIVTLTTPKSTKLWYRDNDERPARFCRESMTDVFKQVE